MNLWNTGASGPHLQPAKAAAAKALALALAVGACLAGAGLNTLAGDLASSGVLPDLVSAWQTVGAELGGAINGVSHGEIEIAKRGAMLAMRALG